MAAMPARPGLAAPSFVRKHHLTERIKLLLKEVSMSRRRLIFSLAAVVVAAIVAGGLAVWYFPLKTGEEVFRAGSGVTAPVVVQKVEPKYSEEARNAKFQGKVVLYVEVAPEGRADNIKVLESLGLGLDDKAIEAIRQWKFKPGMKDGKPVRVAATIEINFRLL
jgi:TonB family protein